MPDNADFIGNFVQEAQENGFAAIDLLPEIPGVEALAPELNGLAAGRLYHGLVRRRGDLLQVFQDAVINDPKVALTYVLLQNEDIGKAAKISKFSSDLWTSFSQVTGGEEFGKHVADAAGVNQALSQNVGGALGGFMAGFDGAEVFRKMDKKIPNLKNSFGGRGITKFGNITVNGTSIEGPQPFNEVIASRINNFESPKIKMNNPNQLSKAVQANARARNGFSQLAKPIKPGGTLGNNVTLGTGNNTTKPSLVRQSIDDVINKTRGGASVDSSLEYLNSTCDLSIEYSNLEFESRKELLKNLFKFRKRILLTIVFGSIIYIIFRNRRSLSKFVRKFIKIYRKLCKKWYTFSNRRIFNNFFTKVIKRGFYVGYHLNKAHYFNNELYLSDTQHKKFA